MMTPSELAVVGEAIGALCTHPVETAGCDLCEARADAAALHAADIMDAALLTMSGLQVRLDAVMDALAAVSASLLEREIAGS